MCILRCMCSPSRCACSAARFAPLCRCYMHMIVGGECRSLRAKEAMCRTLNLAVTVALSRCMGAVPRTARCGAQALHNAQTQHRLECAAGRCTALPNLGQSMRNVVSCNRQPLTVCPGQTDLAAGSAACISLTLKGNATMYADGRSAARDCVWFGRGSWAICDRPLPCARTWCSPTPRALALQFEKVAAGD